MLEAKGWEAQLAVVARGGGGAAGRAARAEQRQQAKQPRYRVLLNRLRLAAT
jgi:hypothetical protein